MTIALSKELIIIGEYQGELEQEYLEVRQKEGRVYADALVAQLPFLDPDQAHAAEWKLRAKSMERFLGYLQKRANPARILDIGCGNGWFTHRCSKYASSAIGIDVNLAELKQACRVFQADNLQYYYWDLFTKSPFESVFDIIVLNAVVQYFRNFEVLLNRLKELLNSEGEIHLIDSPFYSKEAIDAAKERTINYYSGMGVPKMADRYFHHDIAALKQFEVLFKPPSKLKKLIWKDSPFCWYRYQQSS